MMGNIKNKKAALFLMALVLALTLCGCQGKEQALRFVDELQVMLGGEPFAVRRLREEPLVTEDGIHQEYYFGQLTQEEQRVYRQILNGVREFEEEILVTSAQDAVLDRAYHALLKDHPELFWIHGRGITYKTLYKTYGSFQPTYSYDRETAAAVQEEIDAAVTEVKEGAEGLTGDYAKAKYVYESVIARTVYQETSRDQSIAGSLGEGAAVCAGYARAVQLFLEELGVECLYVSGDMKDSTQGHAWNIVNLEGNYYYLDATNGDQQDFILQEGEGTILYDYLCPIPGEYEVICQPEAGFTVPECTASDYNYYVQNGGYFPDYDWDTLYGYICQQVELGKETIQVKYGGEEAFSQAWMEWITQESIASGAEYYMSFHGLEQLQYYYGALNDLYTIYFMF